MRKYSSRLRVIGTIAWVSIALFCLAVQSSSGQKKVWRSGTILKVTAHTGKTENADVLRQYDISVSVSGKTYVVLYTSPKNKPEPSYYVGTSVAVSIEGNVLKFNDLRGNTRTARILSVEDSPPEP